MRSKSKSNLDNLGEWNLFSKAENLKTLKGENKYHYKQIRTLHRKGIINIKDREYIDD